MILWSVFGVYRRNCTHDAQQLTKESCYALWCTQLSPLDVHLVSSTLEEYPGPDCPVDVVCMMHLLYYFGNERCSVIQKAMGWLKPRGRLVIRVVNEDNILQKLGTCVLEYAQYHFSAECTVRLSISIEFLHLFHDQSYPIPCLSH